MEPDSWRVLVAVLAAAAAGAGAAYFAYWSAEKQMAQREKNLRILFENDQRASDQFEIAKSILIELDNTVEHSKITHEDRPAILRKIDDFSKV